MNIKQGDTIKITNDNENYLPLATVNKMLMSSAKSITCILTKEAIEQLAQAHKEWKEMILLYYPELKKWNYTTVVEREGEIFIIVVTGKKE